MPYMRCMMDEPNRLVGALQSLSGAFSGRGASAIPPLGGIVYKSDLRLAVRNPTECRAFKLNLTVL